jgi:hypothetical protein
MKQAAIIAACCLALGAGLVARQGQGMGPGQAAAPNLVGEVQRQYTAVSTNASKAAEQFPEDKYKWQPTPEVRTWAQLVAHMTDDANGNCWQIAGLEARPAGVERGTPAPNDKSKADLVAGFKAAVDVCQKAFAAVTPENMLQPSGGRGNASKIGQLITITAHANEHYGNMVTYMRLQGLVPPSSQRGGGPAPRQ